MMRRFIAKNTHFFCRCEKGNASIEFVFWFPIFFLLTASGIDLGLTSLRYADLERVLDEAIREVRVNNLPAGESIWTHDVVKSMMCERALFIQDCPTDLALEMKSIDPFAAFSDESLDSTPFCADTPETIHLPEDRVFAPGTSNEFMIVRACIEVSPLWSGSWVGKAASTRNSGQVELYATTVFVHEPL